MNNIRKTWALIWVFALVLSFMAVSCVKEEYEIKEDTLNLEVTVFQEGIEIPIGSTEALKLKSLMSKLDSETLEYFKTGEGGDFSLGMSDSFDLSDSLSALTEMIDIPDVEFSQDFSFSLANMDVSDLEIKATRYEMPYDLGSMVGTPEIKVPSITKELSYSAGLYKYLPDLSQFGFNLPAVDIKRTLGSFSGAELIPEMFQNDTEIPIDPGVKVDIAGLASINPMSTTFQAEPVTMKVNMELPKGISSVDQINLKEGAKVKITMSLQNTIFSSGTISPYIDVDLSDIFRLSDDENAAHPSKANHVVADFNLKAAGDVVTKEYEVLSVIQNPQDWKTVDGHLVFSKDITVNLGGSLSYSGLATTTRVLASRAGTPMEIGLKAEFLDFNVGDVTLTIDSQEPISINETATVPLEVPSIKLPDGVSAVKYVEFTDDSSIDISIDAKNVLNSIALGLETLEITFPQGVEVEGAVNGKLSFPATDLKKGFNKQIKIKKFVLPEPVNGNISYSGNVTVKAVASAVVAGSVSTSELPTGEADDMKLDIAISSAMDIADYAVVLAGFDYGVDKKETISAKIPNLEQLGGSLTVYPEGNPVISMKVTLPETSVPVVATKGGLTIVLPEMLRFDENAIAKYGYSSKTHSIVIAEGAPIPTDIQIPITAIVVKPVLDETDNNYYINGEFSVKGNIGIAAGGEIHKSDVDNLTNADAKVNIVIDIPKITPGNVGIDNFSTSIDKKFSLELLAGEQIPEMIVSVGQIKLKDVYINLALDASSLPSLGNADLTFDFDVDIPEMIVLENGRRNEDGILKLTGRADKDGMIKVDPIKVEAIDFTGIDLRDEKGITDTIAIKGSVVLANADLEVDQWLGKDLSLSFDAGIKDIVVSSIEGKVDYQLDPVESSIDLSEVSTILNTDNISTTLDVSHVHLAIEVATNLGISADAQLELIPYHGAVADKPIKVDLALEAPATPGEVKRTKYWLGSKQECCPSDYTFKQVPILDLIKNIPDSIQFKLGAGTDATKPCILSPNVTPVLKADYALDIPLALGEDFCIEYRDTIPDVPEIVSTIFQYGNLSLTGEVESSLPFRLDLTANLLDKDGNVIPLAEDAGKQVINACNLDGSASKTDLALKMVKKAGSVIPEIASVELVLNATATPGVALNEESYIKVALQALVPDGVTVDLNDYVFAEEGTEK